MIIVLNNNVTKKETEEFSKFIEHLGVKSIPIYGEMSTVLWLVGDTSQIDIEQITRLPYVEKAMRVQDPFKQVNRRFHPKSIIVEIGDIKFGSDEVYIMAGPCSVENKNQMDVVTEGIIKSGAKILRGGTFKPRSSPYAFQGLKLEGLRLMKEQKEKHNIPIISELTSLDYLDDFLECVDIIQVGARSMQNFEMLKELGQTKKPVLLKRGFSNTIDELLMSAEYVVNGGNENVILCERGIRTFENRTRNTLDIAAIPILKKLSPLPVVVDPSHAAGRTDLIESLSLASIAAGADGLIIEVHNEPKKALSDGGQSLTVEEFDDVMKKIKSITKALGKKI